MVLKSTEASLLVSGVGALYFSVGGMLLHDQDDTVVSVGSGPWDQLFGGGNPLAFAVAAVATLVSGLMAVLAIPRSGGQKSRTHTHV